MQELPDIQAYNTSSTNYDLTTLTSSGSLSGNLLGGTTSWQTFHPNPPEITATQTESESMSNRRIVQVFIADPNENVPLEKSLLYQDKEPHLTDLTDQELFFELDIKNILDKHNEYRVTVTDKEASEGKNNDVKLEKAKIRDLKMTVVTVAQF